jgi:ligand-binding sensor protein
MQLDTSEFLRQTRPANVLDLLGEATVSSLLNGYSHALNAGVALVFPLTLATPAPLSRKDALDEKAAQSFYPLCKAYALDCHQRGKCYAWDDEVVSKFISGAWNGPKLFRCPLQLWDMACPLRLDKRVVGVLFAGQILTNPAPGSWQQALGQIRDLVAWETVPDTANQADDVIAAIQHRPELSSNDKSQLEQVLEMEAQRCDRNVPVDTLLDRFAKFREFAEMMQCLIARLHAANVLAAGQQLAQRCAEVLAGLDLHQPEQWVAQASTMVDTLRQLAP